MKVIISILFGKRGSAVGWIVEQEVERTPTVGMPVKLRIDEEADLSLEGQVFRVWDADTDTGEPGGLFIYGGTLLPPTVFVHAMEHAGWEPLTSEGVKVLLETAESTPALASIHEVTLAVGSVDDPDGMLVFQRTLRPADPAIPLFGQRLRLEAIRDISIEELASSRNQDDEENDSATSHDVYQDEIAAIDNELADPSNIDGLEDGLPVVTLYSSTVRTGMGRVLFWTPTLGKVTAFDMVANDWEVIHVPSRFNPAEFRLDRRLELAMNTRLTFEESDYGTLVVKDWFIGESFPVDDEDHELMPRLLVEFSKAQREFANIDAVLDEWRQSGTDTDDGSSS